MKTNENYNFNLSVSTKNYTDKNKINWGSVTYKRNNLSIDNFIELIKSGFTFCYNFTDNYDVFGQSTKTLKNFKYTNTIMIDIDDSVIEMNVLINQLSVKPTLAYTTPNNYTEKSNFLYRFRLVYMFEEKIEDIETYKAIYSSIINIISNNVKNFELKDNCAMSVNQQFAGSNEQCKIYKTYNVFLLSDFAFKNNIREKREYIINLKCKKEITNIKTNSKVDIVDKEFFSDLKSMRIHLLIEKYRDKYKYFTSTELTYNEKGVAMIPSDYIEIYRSWHKASFEKKNGTVVQFTAVKKLKDGDKRRKKLYIAALIMKKIMPEITYEHLLFNLINERYYYYNNSDNQLSNEMLSSIAASVINTSIEDIKLNSKPKKAKFKIDKSYCECVLGISANQYKQVVKKQMNDELIGSNYDCSISLKDNLAYFKENDIKVSQRKLYEWCKENNIETNPNKKKSKKNDSANALSSFDNLIENEIECSIEDNFAFKNNIREEKNTLLILNAKNTSEKPQLSEKATWIYSQLYQGMEYSILEYVIEKYKDKLKDNDIQYLNDAFNTICVAA